MICFVTDRKRFGTEDRLVATARAVARAGVHLIQVRERDLDGGALLRLVARCLDAVGGTRTRVLVNDRLDVALAAGAHGVHLPGHGVPAPQIRRIAPQGFIVGRSVHEAGEAERAVAEGGLDYMLFGPVFATESKPGAPPAGVAALRAVASGSRVPVLAIGGVSADRAPHIAAAGAAGFAAIGLFAGAGPDEERLQTLVRQATLAFDTLRGLP